MNNKDLLRKFCCYIIRSFKFYISFENIWFSINLFKYLEYIQKQKRLLKPTVQFCFLDYNSFSD